MGIKFNDKHIPDSPYKVYITPSMGEARKVELAQFPDQGAMPNKPQSLLVCKNGAKGHLDCKVGGGGLFGDMKMVIDNF